MAEPESILQLGIEAARENKKEEARQLFRLLTRQEPDNVQGWLWLAGVAENREERQASLERVLELEPSNEMAQKGLQALGVRPAVASGGPAVVAAAPPPPPARPDTIDEDPFGDDDPFAELNNLSDVMADDTAGPVRRSEPVARDMDLDAAAVGSAAAASAAASARSAEASARGAARNADSSWRGGRKDDGYEDDDATYQPRRGLSPLLALLLGLVGIGLIGLLIFTLFGRGGEQVASGDAAATAAAQTAEASLAPTTDAGTGGAAGGTTDPNAAPTADAGTGGAAGGTTDPNAAPTADAGTGGATGGTTDPNAGTGGTPAAPPADVSGANPAIIPANTPIQSENWVYDFPQATYAASIIGNLGQFTPSNGRFVVVLIHAINNTGNPQAVPGNFFVVKDAQGRVWEARPEVSDAYVVPGVNADQTHNTPIPSDGNYRSVAIVFDVAPDATDLVFFARSNPAQGWIILRSV
jgi:hypothetical protein